MADKEATVYIVDVGKSMGKRRHGREQTDLEWAMRYVWDKITSTVYTGRKTTLLGVVGLGTDETDNELGDDESYQHISVLQPIAQILMPELRQLEEIIHPSKMDERDAISAIILSIQLIEKHCKRLKYIKKIVLVTNGTGTMDPDNVDEIATKLQKESIELVVLGLDFDDAEYGFKEDNKPPEKARNERLLQELVEKSEGIIGTLQEAIEELSKPRVKTVRPVATYKGELRLGDPNFDTALTIQIERYPKVMRRPVPSASSFVLRSQGSSDAVTNVRSSYVYEIRDPEALGGKRHVDRDELAKGYEYGRTAVHINETDENITKFETDASYDILGFIPKDRVERYTFLENSSVLIAQKGNVRASLALSSFTRALYELDSCAIARLVKKDMTGPQINLLSPLAEDGFECLVENQLPFAEDLRSYRFPPLDKVLTVSGKSLTQHRNLPSQDLTTAMDTFVDGMMLSDDERSIEDTFSSVVHRVEDAVKYRAIHPDQPIPPVSDVLIQPSKPSQLEAVDGPLQESIKAADVKKVPPKVKGRRRYRETEKPLSGLNVEDLFAANPKPTISPDNAIPEFKRMLAASEDLETVKHAMKQMTAIVETQIKNSYADLAYGMALEEIGVMRQEMVELEEPALYNDVVRELKRKLLAGELGGNRKEMWHMIRSNRLGLIDKRVSHVSNIGQEEAETFMSTR